MYRIGLAAAAMGALLVLAQPAAAQQNQGGIGGALDQLNRAVNPNSYEEQRRTEERRVRESDRRYEGSSGDRRADAGEYDRYSDRDLRERYDRLMDEQRQIQRERRAMEDEMGRRGIRR